MNIQSEKLDLISWISTLENPDVIEQLQVLKENYSTNIDWFSELSNPEMESIDRGLQDIENGRLNDHEKAKKVYGKYL